MKSLYFIGAVAVVALFVLFIGTSENTGLAFGRVSSSGRSIQPAVRQASAPMQTNVNIPQDVKIPESLLDCNEAIRKARECGLTDLSQKKCDEEKKQLTEQLEQQCEEDIAEAVAAVEQEGYDEGYAEGKEDMERELRENIAGGYVFPFPGSGHHNCASFCRSLRNDRHEVMDCIAAVADDRVYTCTSHPSSADCVCG